MSQQNTSAGRFSYQAVLGLVAQQWLQAYSGEYSDPHQAGLKKGERLFAGTPFPMAESWQGWTASLARSASLIPESSSSTHHLPPRQACMCMHAHTHTRTHTSLGFSKVAQVSPLSRGLYPWVQLLFSARCRPDFSAPVLPPGLTLAFLECPHTRPF